MTPTFDPRDYREQLGRGLELSGENAEYFACERVRHVQRACRDRGVMPENVLEWGCGLGTNLRFLSEAFPNSKVFGVDVSQQMLSAGRRQLDEGVTLLHVDDRPFVHEFDLIYVNGLVHHIPLSERPGVMDRIHRALVPGGLLAAFDNNPLNPGAMWVMRRIEFDRGASPLTAESMKKLLRCVGFVDLHVRYYFYFPRALQMLRWSEPALARVPLGAQYVVWARAG